MTYNYDYLKSYKTYQYRIYPTKSQLRTLDSMLEECRWLYNHHLAEKRKNWSELQYFKPSKSIKGELALLKIDRPSLRTATDWSLREARDGADRAFHNFLRRTDFSKTTGYPRFKSRHRYNTLRFSSRCLITSNCIELQKLKNVKLRLHRPLPGRPVRIALVKRPTGKWFVNIKLRFFHFSLKKNNKSVGIDLGLKQLATLSDGTIIPNLRFRKHEEKSLSKASRQGKRKVIVRINEKIKNRRTNYNHQISRKIVNEYGTICLEDLNIRKMTKGNLAKPILDASWGQLTSLIVYKAEDAGRHITLVNPYNTTKMCSRCGTLVEKDLGVRTHNCPNCNLVIDRDLNAAINILTLGLQRLGIDPKSPARQEVATIHLI